MKILSSLRIPTVSCLTFLVFAGAFGLGGCTEKKEKQPPLTAAPTKKVESPPPPQTEKAAPLSLGHRFPVGPRLVLLPGKGAGPIRFGATVETIERHMEGPCDKKTDDRCLYVRAAIEFFLEDGKLQRIKAHRRDREVTNPPANGEKYYGSLRGIVLPQIMLGLHRHIVLEEFGEPKEKKAVSPPGPDGLVDRHSYEGIRFEYDTIENGSTVLAAIEIYPSQSPYAPPLPPKPKGPPVKEQRAK
jgi:hypothetical protein